MSGSLTKPLAVSADLRLSVDEHDVWIRGADEQLVVELPSLRAGAALLRSLPSRTRPATWLQGTHQLLHTAGLTADVHLAGKPLLRLGHAATPGLLSRVLRLGDVDVRPLASRRATRYGVLLGASLLLAVLATRYWLLHRKT